MFNSKTSAMSLAEQFFQHFKFPDSTVLGVKIAKKTLLENTELVSSDKAIVKDVIQSLIWRYTIKPETANIPVFDDEVYEYHEIAVLHVSLKSQNKTKQVCKLLHAQIPYPTCLVVEYQNNLQISLADKRINQADSSKLIVTQQYNTDWLVDNSKLTPVQQAFLQDMQFHHCSMVSLYDFYQDLVKKLNLLDAARFSGQYGVNRETDSNSEDLKQTLNQLDQLQSQLLRIRNELKNTQQMNQKMQLNVEARAVKLKIKSLKEAL